MNRTGGVPLIAWCSKDQRRALYEKKKFKHTNTKKSSAQRAKDSKFSRS